MVFQLYYKTISPKDLGIYAANSWNGQVYRIKGKDLKQRIVDASKSLRGNISDVYNHLEDNEWYDVSAKWYGGINNRWKLNIN